MYVSECVCVCECQLISFALTDPFFFLDSSTNKANEYPLKERDLGERLWLCSPKQKKQKADSSQTLRQMYAGALPHRNLCLSCMTLAMVFGKSPWARLSSK